VIASGQLSVSHGQTLPARKHALSGSIDMKNTTLAIRYENRRRKAIENGVEGFTSG
jgi:hypothetical protein